MAEGKLSEQQVCAKIHKGDTIRYYTGIGSQEAEGVVDGYYSSGTPGALSEGVLLENGQAIPGVNISQCQKTDGSVIDFR